MIAFLSFFEMIVGGSFIEDIKKYAYQRNTAKNRILVL